MYTNTTSIAAAWSFSATSSSSATGSSGTGEGDAFAKLFSSIRNGSQNGLDDVLGKLSDRFPGLSFTTPSKSGTAASEEVADTDEVKDIAEIDENALAEMSASQSFSSLIEKALSSFLDATKNMQSMDGAYASRSVSITVTTIRLSVNQIDSSSGEKLASQELASSIKEKLDELIQKLFGTGASGQATDEESEETEEGSKTNALDKTNDKWSNFDFGMSGWSMQLYYSQTFMQGSQSGNAATMSSWSAGFSMQGLTSSLLPQELAGIMNGENSLDTLREKMTSLGLSISSFGQAQDGITMRIGQSRNLLSELMEVLNQQRSQRPPVPAAAPEEEEDEELAAQEAQEVEAAEVAAE